VARLLARETEHVLEVFHARLENFLDTNVKQVGHASHDFAHVSFTDSKGLEEGEPLLHGALDA
jgi:hypothetical protein